MVLTIALFCGLILSPLGAQATLITIQIEAVVDGVNDPDTDLEGLVKIGDLITGIYTYDTDTPDSSSSANVGRYEHYSYPCGFSLSVSGLDFMTDPTDTYFEMFVVNNNAGVDGYSVTSYINLPLSDGTSVSNIKWSLQDTSELALSSTNLATTAPALDAWEANYLDIRGQGVRTGFAIQGHVTSAVVVPEPNATLLLGLGAIALVRKVKK